MLLQDDDAWPAPGMLARFHAAETTGCAAIATAVRTPDGQICDMNRPLSNPFRSLRVFFAHRTWWRRKAFHLADTDYTKPDPNRGRWWVFLWACSCRATRSNLQAIPTVGCSCMRMMPCFAFTFARRAGASSFCPTCTTPMIAPASDADGALTPDWKLYFYHRNLLILYRAAAGRLFWPALLVILPKWLWRLWAGGGNRARRARLMLWGLRHGLRGDTPLVRFWTCARKSRVETYKRDGWWRRATNAAAACPAPDRPSAPPSAAMIHRSRTRLACS